MSVLSKFLTKTCCGYSKGQYQRDSSFEHLKHVKTYMLWVFERASQREFRI